MTNEAIVIGVNKYEFLQPLDYARQDALAMKTFLEMEAKFDRVYYFAEDAPPVNGVSMKPTRNNLRRVMRDTFAKPFMGDGDNFWFFFSGHGIRYEERDFLMLIDGDPDDVAESGISTAQVSEWLRGCGADNVVMILDACRSGGRKDGKGIGDETREGCRQTGVISLFSCSPNQFSYELPQYQQGAFTKVLLEGLGAEGACATVARLDEYLKRRVPEVVCECLGHKVKQFPYTIAEPISRSNLILMPQHSNPSDIATLKNDAYREERNQDWKSAKRLWIRINGATAGQDMDAINSLQNLGTQDQTRMTSPHLPSRSIPSKASPDPIATPKKEISGRSNIAQFTFSESIANQLLKWIIPVGVGLGGAVVAIQVINIPRPTLPSTSPPSVPAVSPSPIVVAVDYSKLAESLKARKWQDADQETANLMAKVTNRETGGWMEDEDMKNFPCEILRKLDSLWLENSNGKFGFSVQKKIYAEKCGGQLEGSYEEKAWNCLGDRVGWRVNGKWMETVQQTTLDISAPSGHLPSLYRFRSANFLRLGVVDLTFIKTCKI
jgi:uncharacterized caspase-like protein